MIIATNLNVVVVIAENIQRGFDNNPFKDIFAYRHLFAIPHSNKARKPP